jgi:hypothetical protein
MGGKFWLDRPRSHVKLCRWSLALFPALVAACATAPSQPIVERLDPDTATTVTAIKKPVELVAENLHNVGSDPFAFIAPFETDRMGSRAQYLWMSAPGVENATVEPQLMCDGRALTLSPVDADVKRFGLSQAPYEKPAPWSVQWYFQLPPDTLKCLADAQRVTLETHASTGQSDEFAVDGKGLAAIKAFASR